jgi:hypothetical protein
MQTLLSYTDSAYANSSSFLGGLRFIIIIIIIIISSISITMLVDDHGSIYKNGLTFKHALENIRRVDSRCVKR